MSARGKRRVVAALIAGLAGAVISVVTHALSLSPSESLAFTLVTVFVLAFVLVPWSELPRD